MSALRAGFVAARQRHVRFQWKVLPGVLSALVLLVSSAGNAETPASRRPEVSPKTLPLPTSLVQTQAVRAEQLRTACLEGRRCVCGRVLKVFPTGVLVESGFPSLLRDSLHGAWHLPRTVVASRLPNLVESQEPDSICVGTVFLTDLPKLRGGKKEPIAPYDYVVLHSYPAGEFTYRSVGNIQHTVRRFSGGLETAVKLILKDEQSPVMDPGR